MNFDYNVLSDTEKVTFALRSLYKACGYEPYRMSKFEEYDFYSKNRDFLGAGNVLTFTGTDGRLMALKPDVTLSLIKDLKDDPAAVRKLYYDENVFRAGKGTGTFSEIKQIGLECVGAVDEECVGQVLFLAAKSLEMNSGKFVLLISQLDIAVSVIDRITKDGKLRSALVKCLSEKNVHEMDDICKANGLDEEAVSYLKKLALCSGKPSEVIPKLDDFKGFKGAEEASASLERTLKIFKGSGLEDHIIVDFSVVDDMKYYNSVIFKGYIEGIPGSVLSGGQYDRLLKRLGRKSKAIGFAVYLDMLDNRTNGGVAEGAACDSGEMVNVALPKGRLGEKVYSMFERSGCGCPEMAEDSRKLFFENREAGIRFFWVKPSMFPSM